MKFNTNQQYKSQRRSTISRSATGNKQWVRLGKRNSTLLSSAWSLLHKVWGHRMLPIIWDHLGSQNGCDGRWTKTLNWLTFFFYEWLNFRLVYKMTEQPNEFCRWFQQQYHTNAFKIPFVYFSWDLSYLKHKHMSDWPILHQHTVSSWAQGSRHQCSLLQVQSFRM